MENRTGKRVVAFGARKKGMAGYPQYADVLNGEEIKRWAEYIPFPPGGHNGETQSEKSSGT